MSEDTLTDSDVPEEIRVGCKTPMPWIVRAAVAAAGCVAVYLAAAHVTGRAFAALSPRCVTSECRDRFSRIGRVVQFVAAGGAVWAAYGPLWTLLRKYLRECSTYRMFQRLYREEIGQKGMTKETAIREALEKVELHQQYRRRRHGSGAPLIGISF